MCEEYEQLRKEASDRLRLFVHAKNKLEAAVPIGHVISLEEMQTWKTLESAAVAAKHARNKADRRAKIHLKNHHCWGA
jgi:hypothetical protein